MEGEREFLGSLRTIYDVYARPLRKLCSISDDDQKQLFGGVEPVLSVSNMLLTKVRVLTLLTFYDALTRSFAPTRLPYARSRQSFAH